MPSSCPVADLLLVEHEEGNRPHPLHDDAFCRELMASAISDDIISLFHEPCCSRSLRREARGER